MIRPKDYIYVANMGGFWRLTLAQWIIGVLTPGAAGEGYDLTPYQQIAKPRWIRKSDTGRFYTMRGDVRFYEPLDWTPEQFREQLEEELERG